MKKLFKSLTVLLLAVAAAVACVVIAGCANDNDTPPVTQADYVFILQYKDGTKVNGQTGNKNGNPVQTQICLTGAGAQCYPLFTKGIYPDENGKIELSQAQVNEILKSQNVSAFVFHAYDIKDGKQDSNVTVTEKGTYTVIVDEAE